MVTAKKRRNSRVLKMPANIACVTVKGELQHGNGKGLCKGDLHVRLVYHA